MYVFVVVQWPRGKAMLLRDLVQLWKLVLEVED